jgi:repressor LexA
MEQLTPRQAELLALIKRLIEQTGVPPTRAELAREMGFSSVSTAVQHLQALARKGVIELMPDAARGIVVKQTSGLPIVGQVAAGHPILAEEHIEAHCLIDPHMFSPPAHYFLRVRGMSMRDAGILDGDLLAVHVRPEASNGQIVVVRVENEATVKRFKRKGDKVWLLPANPEFEPIVIDLRVQPLIIEGIGVGILRNRSLG